MIDKTLSPQTSALYREALSLYRASTRLARTSCRWVNAALCRNALRVLEHSAVASTDSTAGLRVRASRYARLALARLTAAVDATCIDEDVDDSARQAVASAIEQLALRLAAVVVRSDASCAAPRLDSLMTRAVNAQPREVLEFEDAPVGAELDFARCKFEPGSLDTCDSDHRTGAG